MNDYERANYISENSLYFINQRAWVLVDAARKYLTAEDFRRRNLLEITAKSNKSWQAFTSEVDAYRLMMIKEAKATQASEKN